MIYPINREQAREIIEKNVDVVDTSVAEFLIRCYRDAVYAGSGQQFGMAEVLYKAIIPELGGYQNVLNTITNDERYFKWDSIDKYNKEKASSGSDNYTMLHYLYSAFRSIADDIGGEADKEIAPDVDFILDASSWNFNTTFPAVIADGYQYSCASKKFFPKDLYTGVVVSKSVYPNADTSAIEDKHLVDVLLEPKPIGESKVDYPAMVSTRSNLRYTKIGYDDPGIIYVPVKQLYKAIKDILPRGWKSRFVYGTCLPKHILDKYGLPTMEI